MSVSEAFPSISLPESEDGLAVEILRLVCECFAALWAEPDEVSIVGVDGGGAQVLGGRRNEEEAWFRLAYFCDIQQWCGFRGGVE